MPQVPQSWTRIQHIYKTREGYCLPETFHNISGLFVGDLISSKHELILVCSYQCKYLLSHRLTSRTKIELLGTNTVPRT